MPNNFPKLKTDKIFRLKKLPNTEKQIYINLICIILKTKEKILRGTTKKRHNLQKINWLFNCLTILEALKSHYESVKGKIKLSLSKRSIESEYNLKKKVSYHSQSFTKIITKRLGKRKIHFEKRREFQRQWLRSNSGISRLIKTYY